MPRPLLAVVSPFIDKRHGTERRVAECVERLSGDFEIHVYSQRVEDVDLSRIVWHRVSALPGPHLFAYLWWFAANHFRRWRDRRFRGLVPALVYSPGINCWDADAISVHALFARFRMSLGDEISFARNPVRVWPRLLHRRLYYRLIESLERRIYTRENVPLAVVSKKIARDLDEFYGRAGNLRVVYGGLDLARFNPERRVGLRSQAREAFGLGPSDFAVLLIGNDWKSKGLPCLLQAAGAIGNSRLRILVAGTDTAAPYASPIERFRLSGRVQFLAPRADVEFFYAAADAYVSPSLEDAFAQPPAEAMACGLPVITSRNNGGSEIISHEADGLILEDPADSAALAEMLRRLLDDSDFRMRLGQNAARTARKFTWDANAAQLKAMFDGGIQAKRAAQGTP